MVPGWRKAINKNAESYQGLGSSCTFAHVKVYDQRLTIMQTGTGQRAINRGRSIQSVAWMPSGNGFLSVEYKSQSRVEVVAATNLVRLVRVIYLHRLSRG